MNDRYRIVGIDPGKEGGIAVVENNYMLDVWKMPETPADVYYVLKQISERRVDDREPVLFKVFLELVGASRGRDGRKQGVASTAKFMHGYGVIEGILTAMRLPFEKVAPGVWQRSLNCLTGGKKAISKQKAQQTYPYTTFTNATADAALIAHYGMLKLTRTPPQPAERSQQC